MLWGRSNDRSSVAQARTGRGYRLHADDIRDLPDTQRAPGRHRLDRFPLDVGDLRGRGDHRTDSSLFPRASLLIAWATPEQSATVKLELKVKPRLQFLHG